MEEENEYRTFIYDKENEIEFKFNKNLEQPEKIEYIKANKNIIEPALNDNELYIHINWLKFNANICRYDSFFFLYIFCINYELNKDDINNNILIYNIISDEILKLSSEELNKGIWVLIDKYKTNSRNA